MTGFWHCLDCTDHGTGTPAEVDLAARKHTDTGHATATRLVANRKKP